jgi:hypothetical protein
MNAPLEVLASFTDYEGLRRALNAVRDQHRDISLEMLDEITGAPKGYFSKLLGPRAAKRVGLQSLGWAMGGLGIKAVFVEDPEALARVQSRFEARDAPHLQSVLGDAVHIQLSRGFLRKIGAKGGANSRKNLGKRMRKKLAQRAATARWKRQKQKTKQRKAAHKARKQAGNL